MFIICWRRKVFPLELRHPLSVFSIQCLNVFIKIYSLFNCKCNPTEFIIFISLVSSVLFEQTNILWDQSDIFCCLLIGNPSGSFYYQIFTLWGCFKGNCCGSFPFPEWRRGTPSNYYIQLGTSSRTYDGGNTWKMSHGNKSLRQSNRYLREDMIEFPQQMNNEWNVFCTRKCFRSNAATWTSSVLLLVVAVNCYSDYQSGCWYLRSSFWRCSRPGLSKGKTFTCRQTFSGRRNVDPSFHCVSSAGNWGSTERQVRPLETVLPSWTLSIVPPEDNLRNFIRFFSSLLNCYSQILKRIPKLFNENLFQRLKRRRSHAASSCIFNTQNIFTINWGVRTRSQKSKFHIYAGNDPLSRRQQFEYKTVIWQNINTYIKYYK